VTWALTGSCVKSAGTFTCRATVKASNGLQSGGFVEVYPGLGYRPDCEQHGPLVRAAVTITGTCPTALAPTVLALYTATSVVSADQVLARANLPWS
jgi:hypothetical protein